VARQRVRAAADEREMLRQADQVRIAGRPCARHLVRRRRRAAWIGARIRIAAARPTVTGITGVTRTAAARNDERREVGLGLIPWIKTAGILRGRPVAVGNLMLWHASGGRAV
jgi:hypothetical protein